MHYKEELGELVTRFDGTLFATNNHVLTQEVEVADVLQRQYRVDSFSAYKQIIVEVEEQNNEKRLMRVNDLYDVSTSILNSSIYLQDLQTELITNVLPAIHLYRKNRATISYIERLQVTAYYLEEYLNERLQGNLKAIVRQVKNGDVINDDSVISVDIDDLTVCYADKLSDFFNTKKVNSKDTGYNNEIEINSYLKLNLKKTALMYDLMGVQSMGGLTNVFEAKSIQVNANKERTEDTVYVAITDTDLADISFPLNKPISTRFYVFTHLDILIQTTTTLMKSKNLDESIISFVLDSLRKFEN
ncbi:hypothetical protein ABC382_01020 [Lysinibacillus sp. 1P01SD]|uniref:hypothetical protein n=1 Tax=Lysinibacillus sp. 1P01SD TaxID=3132285 RepID=UPI0039A0B523